MDTSVSQVADVPLARRLAPECDGQYTEIGISDVHGIMDGKLEGRTKERHDRTAFFRSDINLAMSGVD
jgi:hypothetical protein